MEWIGENWIWLLLVGGMIGMHLFGHGKHGGGGGGGGGCCGGGKVDGGKESDPVKITAPVKR